ncbi:MAG: pyruvate:ferredoxin (flavodoxin) oxidoreductase, partial [Clostridia bacterium]|nr:pyruvate:ferredoxin (flavodoxin) oxidoreductase [Clostridia bacterium]
KVNALAGTDYKLFNYYGAPNAEHIIIAMGSVCDTIEETIDYLIAKGEKVGLVKVRLYRPFSVARLLETLPDSVKTISVLDRTKEPGSLGEPLFLDIVAALRDTEFADIPVYCGRYGLGSKDTTPGQIMAVYTNMEEASPKKRFTIGIEDDLTNLSLKVTDNTDTTPEGTTSCKFWGLGSDGTVGANKNSIKIIGDHTSLYAQGYFAYDSKKSGGVTMSHLRFGKQPIKSTYYVTKADFVACHNPSYIDKYEMVEELKKGGIFLLNCQWDDKELEAHLPSRVKRFIAHNDIQLYTIDGISIARGLGLGGRINTILQAAFFALAKIIPVDDAVKFMKDAATASYGKKGEKIVAMNHAAIDEGLKGAKKVEVPKEWADAKEDSVPVNVEGDRKDLTDFVKNILIPVNGQQGDKLPVSTFKDMADGTFPQGSAAYEKRGIAVDVPEWHPENCIQCTFCSYVCPHAVIRPVALTADEAAKAPAGMPVKDMNGMPGIKYAITVSVLDCTGCGSCAAVCPGLKGNKALVMKPLESQEEKQAQFDYAQKLPEKAEVLAKFKAESVKGSQFRKPLLEYSGACAGCGETPYAKLATQLFGESMYIANATGCSSIWGGSAPTTPYTVSRQGKGPAWANSLFEDNAEYGFGMLLAVNQRRARLADNIEKLSKCDLPAEWGLKEACVEWLAGRENLAASKAASAKLRTALQIAVKECGSCGCDCDALYKEIIAADDMLEKKSVWVFGGDGWAFDIGFGGLDHVIASGEDVNILVFNTEVYSNTGGQSSKATPAGSVAQFAAAGKGIKQKDLAAIAMSYGYVYVAQVAMGADYNQCIKAFSEAESYHGPSVVIAYAPCINHGIKGGMGVSQIEEKNAVQAGYWHNFRFDPRLADDGKNPFTLDSKEPTVSYEDFILNEVRYSSLTRSFPERAKELFAYAEKQAKDKYDHLVKLSKLYE